MDSPAARLRLALQMSKKTQAQVADLYDCSPSHISQMATTGKGMGHGSAEKLAGILDVPAEWLLHGHNPPDWAQSETPAPSRVAETSQVYGQQSVAALKANVIRLATLYIDLAHRSAEAGVQVSSESIKSVQDLLDGMQI